MNTASASEERQQRPEAAKRTFDILTAWLRQHPCDLVTKFRPAESLPFTVHIVTPNKTHIFRGSDMQDAYAQAAQAITFGGLS